MLGQESSIKILRRFVATGKGRYQSYLFCGPYGSGKTTLGRILARALLCEQPTPEGDPCDKCISCQSILESGTSLDFTEVDAATNSGVAEIHKVVESVLYDYCSGLRRLFLFDECFTESTLLLTPDGLKSIRELVESEYSGQVLAADLDEGDPQWVSVANWFVQGKRKTVTLTFDNGVEITVTETQKIATRNRGWVTAQDLTSDDDVIECHESVKGVKHG